MEIPEGWKRTKLGQHVKIHAGVAPANLEFNETDGIPYVKVEDMNNCSKIQKLSRAYVVKLPHPVPAGCVIFPKRGAAIMNNKVRISGTKIVIDTNMMALETNSTTDSEFLYYFVIFKKLFKIADTSTIPQINNKHILPYVFLSPPLPEQKKIAKILSTWDRAIEVVEGLIENSQAQKKALMQQLLTAKKRLPGFDGEWEGEFTFFDRSTDVRRSDRFLFDTEAIIVGGEGQEFIPKYFIGKFDLHQRAYAIFGFEEVDGKYIFYSIYYNRHFLKRFSVGSTVASLRMGTFQKLPIRSISKKEQKAIAAVLSDADQEIELLTQQLTQLKSEKSALMQQLLTGKRRVKIDKEAAA